ncbi:hypothetical protein [Micromonospora sp. M61]|uniref:hypothetical protein n=1 Tax=Micromonospora sp. M61 TaxID=2824890 RepID=UPI001B36C6BD|nr:hypothetical protein [Micromonospora sp. M61]MBQ0977849.1 hypothetical protein [Micromonospora sp. M61]
MLESPVDASADAEAQRAFVALDWLVRVWTPAWTAMVPGVGQDLAAKLQELPPITELASAEAAGLFAGVLESTSAQAEKTIAQYKGNLYVEAAAAAPGVRPAGFASSRRAPPWPTPPRRQSSKLAWPPGRTSP